MGSIGNCCNDTCCTPIALPDETWSNVGDHLCCIQKTVEVEDIFHYLCSGVIRECTQAQSADLRIYRHLVPVIDFDIPAGDLVFDCHLDGGVFNCTIEGIPIPHCDNDVEECGLLSLSATMTTKQKLVLKYKHLRDIVTITKLNSTCEPDETPSCKYLIVYRKIFAGTFGQVNFGSSTKTVSSVTGCCKVTGSSDVVSELTCEEAADELTGYYEFDLSRSDVFDEIPASITYGFGQRVVCSPLPDGLCIAPGGIDGPILCSIDSPITVYDDATCACNTDLVRCYVVLRGNDGEDYGCIISEPYTSERHSKYICGIDTGILPGYDITYDDATCYTDCGVRIDPPGSNCPPNPASVCRYPTGFISKVECEDLTNYSSCTEYSEQCLNIATDNWEFDILV